MKLDFSASDEAFRKEVAGWLETHLAGSFSKIKYRGGPGDEHMFHDERCLWEKTLAASGYTCIGWPKKYGGRGLSIEKQVIFHEEYARFGGPGRVGHIGEGLVGPTLMAFGTEEQKERYLPGILSGEDLWCQGYSEPHAGSDLAAVTTRAYRNDKGAFCLKGQKVWTSLAMTSKYCFVLARMDPDSNRHKGLGFFLLKMDQPGVSVVPIKQLTGTSEFSEVFFDGAVCEDLVGEEGEGWKVAMALLGFERGVSTLGQQMLFQNELNQIISLAKENGASQDPIIRQRIAKSYAELKVMRANSLRTLSVDESSQKGQLGKSALIYKLFWASWHRKLGELAMDVLGEDGALIQEAPYELHPLQSLFLFVRSDTIYGGTNEIQKNIIAERGLAMPKEPQIQMNN